ncbi:MAG: AhpC/TSA family protein [Prevotella sp.]|nr:AhpC/TSA family protein [Prevotella sp.]
MRKKSYLYAVLGCAMLFVAACQTSQPADNFTIEGSAEGLADGDTLYLTNDINSGIPFDMVVIENGKFNLSGQADISQMCMVYSTKLSELQIPFFLEPGTIQMQLSADGESRVSGTQNNEDLQAINDSIQKYDDNVSIIINNLYENSATKEEHEDAARQTRQEAERLNDYLLRTAQRNINNELGFYILTREESALIPEKRLELIRQMPEQFKSRPEIIEIEKGLNTVTENRAAPEQITDVILTRPDETSTTLAEEVGKNRVTVIHFWASWCAPYLRELPEIKRLYRRYSEDGLGMIGLSLDNDERAWRNSIERYSLTWTQLSDMKGWESNMINAFQVDGLPYFVIADRTGKILATGTSKEELMEVIQEALQ